jgi:hypothetical protein
MEITIGDVHWSHLPRHHHSSGVKLLGDVQLRKQPKNLSKLRQLHMKPSAISHLHKDPLFLVKEESGVELSDDFLILVVPKLQQISDSMEVISLKYPIEVHILLCPHIVYMHKLMLDHRRGLWIYHNPVPVLMKEDPKSFIGASLLG